DITAASGAQVTVTEGMTLPIDRVYNSNAYLRINFPSTGNVNLDGDTPIPAPLFEGMKLVISPRNVGDNQSDTGTVTIPSGSITVAGVDPIVLRAGFLYKFIFYGGKWRLDDFKKSGEVTNSVISVPSSATASSALSLEELV